MRYDEFIDRVQERSRLPNREDVIRITEATLETFGERIPRTEREQLASQLPKELKEYLLKRQDTDRYLLQEFYNRVGARADTGYFDAAKRAKAVMAVLQEAVTEGQLEQVLEELPNEYRDLFNPEREGPGFPSLS